jgi:hypothetical protein
MGVRRASLPIACAAALAIAACAQASTAPPRPFVSALELAPEDPSPGGQFVWIYNPSVKTVNLGCYRLRSNRGTVVIKPSTLVPPQSTATFAPPQAWLRANDQVEVVNRAGKVVSKTPLLRDEAGDGRFWFKRPATEWRFGTARTYGEEVVKGKIATAAVESCKVN